MFGIGMPELLILLLIVLVIFGAGKLPEIGTGLGKAIRGFKKGVSEPDEIDITPKKKDEEKKGVEEHGS
ncbi:MAG: twin-arginine translocase TatA/TatE family subunit [Nitrospiria bacterium]